MQNDVVVDSGPLLALFDREDAHHARVRQALKRNQGLRLLTTWPVLTETSALLSSRVGKDTKIEFLGWDNLRPGAFPRYRRGDHIPCNCKALV